MTPEEYKQQKADIVARTGLPEYDFDRSPLNESARLITELMKARRATGKQDALKELVAEIPKDEIKKAMTLSIGPIFVEEHDLKRFSELERAIIELHFYDKTLNNAELARRCNTQHQVVTALFHSLQFRELRVKYFEAIMPAKLQDALLHLIESGNQKTVERLAEHFGLIKPERQDINITSKPIDDPQALKMLRELGDKWVDGNTKESK